MFKSLGYDDPAEFAKFNADEANEMNAALIEGGVLAAAAAVAAATTIGLQGPGFFAINVLLQDFKLRALARGPAGGGQALGR